MRERGRERELERKRSVRKGDGGGKGRGKEGEGGKVGLGTLDALVFRRRLRRGFNSGDDVCFLKPE